MIDPDKKLCGVLIPVFALRRRGDLGIGDTACVRNAIDFCARNNHGVLQVLPINETGGDNSPYGAISSLALEPVLLTVEPDVVPGLGRETYEKLVNDSGVGNLDQRYVHYQQIKKLKLDLLRAAWQNVRGQLNAGKTEQARDFKSFQQRHADWLPLYTTFRSIIDIHNGNACWTQWQDEYATPESAEHEFASGPDAERLQDDRNFFAFIQWQAFKQWEDLRKYADAKHVRLMGDIPFGVSRYSADVWSWRRLFDLDWSGGAPPEPTFQADDFTRKWGQNWGIPLYNWTEHRNQNYKWWRQRVGRLTDVFHYFRIDHVLGFFRIYAFPWIPERNGEFLELTEEEAEELCEGNLPQFLPRPDEPEENAELNAEEGQAILEVIMEAAGENGVVAEDLGCVPEYVRPLLHDMGIPGFAIPIFERNEEDREFKPADELHPLSLATYATHDHQPIAVFYDDLVARWHGPDGHEAWLDVQRLMRFLDRDDEDPPTEYTEGLRESFMETLLNTRCWLAVNMICDLLGTREQFNQPGSAADSNWSRRLEMTLDEYEKHPTYGPRIKRLARLIVDTGRLPEVAVQSTK